jgi:hypothetical protein
MGPRVTQGVEVLYVPLQILGFEFLIKAHGVYGLGMVGVWVLG